MARRSPANPATDAFLSDLYPSLYAKSKHTVVKPGDRLSMRTVPGAFIANGVDEQPASLPIEPGAAPAPGAGATPPPAHNGPAF